MTVTSEDLRGALVRLRDEKFWGTVYRDGIPTGVAITYGPWHGTSLVISGIADPELPSRLKFLNQRVRGGFAQNTEDSDLGEPILLVYRLLDPRVYAEYLQKVQSAEHTEHPGCSKITGEYSFGAIADKTGLPAEFVTWQREQGGDFRRISFHVRGSGRRLTVDEMEQADVYPFNADTIIVRFEYPPMIQGI